MSDVLPIILSGGSGTRLWPLSRESYPKQFLPLVGDKSMLQSTWLRAAPVAGHAPIVVANEEHRFMAAEQLQQLGVKPSAILLEPKGRNTAPAIAVAALEATRDGADPLLLVLPSDHVIQNEAAFQAAVTLAATAAEQGKLVTFGIKPTAPETGYGYIKASAGAGASAVERFVEKPDLATAQSYLASGEYYWNSGMFLFRASRYLEELRKFHPAIADACQKAWENGKRDADFTRLDKDAFAASPSDSIDYAVMEKTADAVVVPLDAGWNDVGSWSSLLDVSNQDAQGNAHHGAGGIEIARGLAEYQVASGIGAPCLDQRHVGLQRGFQHVMLAVEFARFLALGHDRAVAGGGVKRRNARATGAQTLGQGALRIELQLEFARQVLAFEFLVFAHVGRNHLADLPGGQ